VDVPPIRYAWNGDVALAYQVFGEGPIDLLYLQGFVSHVELSWESPSFAGFLRGLARHARVIHTDRRGWGLSDRFSPNDVPPLETTTDDLLVVLEAAGSERVAIFATQEHAVIAAMFAATYPERTAGLILCDPYTTYVRTDETPWMWSWDGWEQVFHNIRAEYPQNKWWSGPPDHPERAWFDRWIRSGAAPGALIAEFRRFQNTDIRPVLPVIAVPTLVIADPTGTEDIDPRNGKLVADRIAGARFVEIASPDPASNWLHFYGRAEPILRETAAFLATLREDQAGLDRVLATVLFTDIVDSTAQAAAMGDARWREVRAQHDQIVRAHLARFRGTEIKTMGDGFLATFDGPARGVRCAGSIAAAVRPLGIEIRAGLHTGEVTREGDDVAGIGVAIGARVGALAGPGEVLVSRTVKDLVAGSGLAFGDAGEHELKGVPDRWDLYRVVP
jgi:class 3 adenylate cyclase